MKKIMLSMLVIAFAASATFADGTTPVKTKGKAKQTTAVKSLKAKKCTKKCADKTAGGKKDACCK